MPPNKKLLNNVGSEGHWSWDHLLARLPMIRTVKAASCTFLISGSGFAKSAFGSFAMAQNARGDVTTLLTLSLRSLFARPNISSSSLWPSQLHRLICICPKLCSGSGR